MSDEAIAPALTPEQWKMEGGKDVQMLRAAKEGPRVMFRDRKFSEDASGRQYQSDEGFGVELNGDNSLSVWDDSWGIQVAPETRHGLAALCLYGKPFGFTQEDVAALTVKTHPDSDVYHPGQLCCDSVARAAALVRIAAKIAALLPPQL